MEVTLRQTRAGDQIQATGVNAADEYGICRRVNKLSKKQHYLCRIQHEDSNEEDREIRDTHVIEDSCE